MNTIQYDRPLFVRNRYRPVTWKGRSWGFQERFPWAELEVPYETVTTLFNNDQLYHSEELEVKNKVGDRLSELNAHQLGRLVSNLNKIVKDRTVTDNEFKQKKCKVSKIADKQRGLIRQWLRANPWATEEFYTYRDQALGE